MRAYGYQDMGHWALAVSYTTKLKFKNFPGEYIGRSFSAQFGPWGFSVAQDSNVGDLEAEVENDEASPSV